MQFLPSEVECRFHFSPPQTLVNILVEGMSKHDWTADERKLAPVYGGSLLASSSIDAREHLASEQQDHFGSLNHSLKP